MSRNIKSTAHSFTEEEQILQNTEKGKLLFTEVRNRLCAFLIQNNRLKAARVLSESTGKIGAVYVGKVKNVVKNINACFVEIADGEICFLPLKETRGAFLTNRIPDGRILEGDELLVQVTRDAQKTKQASVTAQISLSNDFFVLTLGKTGIGYSAKLSKNDKERIKEFIISNNLSSFGIMVRTQAGECNEDELLKYYHELSTDLVSILQIAPHRSCFSLIKEAPAQFETILHQLVYLNEYEEILTDNEILYHQLTDYIKNKTFPKEIRFYQDETFSLAKLYSLESKLDTALGARIWLKSGGYLILEPTEALTVIDVNSGKYEASKSNQDAIFKINCEAAEEIAIQLRLRNLSGIIVVDFINMDSNKMQEELLSVLRKLVQKDKQKTVVVDMTPLGLVEITRKKEYKPLYEQFNE